MVKNLTGFEPDELWSVHCMFYREPAANCTPCFTFNAPDDWSIERGYPLSITIKESEYQIEEFGLSLHEKNQSNVVVGEFSFSTVQFLKLKSNTSEESFKELMMQKHHKLNKKSDPCDVNDEQNQEKIYYDYMSERLNCNIPWSRFKSSNINVSKKNKSFQ